MTNARANGIDQQTAQLPRRSPRKRKRDLEEGEEEEEGEQPASLPERPSKTSLRRGASSTSQTSPLSRQKDRHDQRTTLPKISQIANGKKKDGKSRQLSHTESAPPLNEVSSKVGYAKRPATNLKASGSAVKAHRQHDAKIAGQEAQDPTVTNNEVHRGEEKSPKKDKRKRKTAEEKARDEMPLAHRTTNLRMYIGAHVSIAKGVENAVTNCHHIGGNAFAMFLKSQRKWENPALSDENRDAFLENCRRHQYDASSHILPHGSYLVNLAVEDEQRAKQAYDAFLDDLHRCEALGIRYYNFHPGAASQSPLPEAIQRLSSRLNSALAATETVTPVLENMAGSGSVIGSKFSELREVIDQIKPEFQSRIGVCLDTCHAFAAGYDLRTPETYQQLLQEFDDVVGIRYLKALHINDSKAPLGSNKDLHQNIGLGFLGLRAFHNVMNDHRLQGLPLILETPCDKLDPDDLSGKKTIEDKGIWATEIKMLEGLIGMDVESDTFQKLETRLAEKGRSEREKMSDAIIERDRKKSIKEAKAKAKEAGSKNLSDMMRAATAKGKKQKQQKQELGDEEEDEDPTAKST